MLDVQAPPDIGSVIQQMAQQFMAVMQTVLATVNATVVEVSRLAYVTILMIGLLLYFAHADRRLGKDLIRGGVILAVLSEFVFPQLARV